MREDLADIVDFYRHTWKFHHIVFSVSNFGNTAAELPKPISLVPLRVWLTGSSGMAKNRAFELGSPSPVTAMSG